MQALQGSLQGIYICLIMCSLTQIETRGTTRETQGGMTQKGKRAIRRCVRRIDVRTTGLRTVTNTTSAVSESYKSTGGDADAWPRVEVQGAGRPRFGGYGHPSCRTRIKKNSEVEFLPPGLLTQYCRGMGWSACADPRANNQKLAAVAV